MDTLLTHYARLLGPDDSWQVDAVDLRLYERRVKIRLAHVGSGVSCAECGQSCGLADHAEKRRWRHLDTMQFTTELVARLPRRGCPDHGVKTIVPPWAGKHSRFTLFFEAFAIEVLQACRTVKAAAEAVLQTLTVDQQQQVVAVAADMHPAYANAVANQTPNAELVHDKFHVAKHLGEAVDQVRRAENKALQAEDDDRLKGTRQLWLFNKANLSPQQRRRFTAIRQNGLKTARAGAIKEEFHWFWRYVYPMSAEEFFAQWYAWGVRCRLRPVIKVVKMLKRHLPHLLSYFRHWITNSTREGFNSVIQALKYAARGCPATKIPEEPPPHHSPHQLKRHAAGISSPRSQLSGTAHVSPGIFSGFSVAIERIRELLTLIWVRQ